MILSGISGDVDLINALPFDQLVTLDLGLERNAKNWSALTLNGVAGTTPILDVLKVPVRQFYVVNGELAVSHDQMFVVQRSNAFQVLEANELRAGDRLVLDGELAYLLSLEPVNDVADAYKIYTEAGTYTANGYLLVSDVR